MRIARLLAVSVSVALLLAAAPAHGQHESAPQLLRPSSGTTITAGWFEIAAILSDKPATLTLALDRHPLASKPLKVGSNSAAPHLNAASSDSLVLRVEPNQLVSGLWIPPVWLTVRTVAAGPHEVTLGATRVRFQACELDATANPTSSSHYVAHPPAVEGVVTCTGCHQLNRATRPPRFDDMAGFLLPETPGVCFRCHDRADFFLTHSHRVEHLSFCQMCHDPHGSNRPALMKTPQEQACKECHE